MHRAMAQVAQGPGLVSDVECSVAMKDRARRVG